MKRIHKLVILAVVLCSLLFATVVSAAGSFKTVYTNSSWDASYRTVGGAVFSSEYNSSTSASCLKVKKDGKTRTITNYSNGGRVISDGSTAYHVVHKSGKHILYQSNLTTGHAKKIKQLAGSEAYSIELAGRYKNDIYFIRDLPEGSLYRINLKNLAVKKISLGSRTVSQAENVGQYFILTDGTGAGHSYLGVRNAATYDLTIVSKKPYTWVHNAKNIYYVEVKSGEPFAGSFTAAIKRYTFATGAKKTLVSSLTMSSFKKLTGTYIEYYDANGNLKTKKW